MSRGTLFSEIPGGGSDRIWLDELGIIQGLVHETTYPGGDSQASWQMNLNYKARHRAWAYGRRIGLGLGASEIWHGYLDNPTRGTTWQMKAVGIAAQAKQYVAYAPTSGNALVLSEDVPLAIGRGLGFTVPSGLTWPTMPTGSGTPTVASATGQLDVAMDQVMAAQTAQTYWSIDTFGNVSPTFTAPTVPTRILYAQGPGGGRNLAGFVTDAFVTYQSAAGVLSTVIRSTATRPFGRFEQALDETGLGLIAAAQANQLGDGFLARNGQSAKFTDTFAVTFGQLTTMGGTAVDLAGERSGFLANVVLTDPDSAGDIALAVVPSVLIGGTSYDWDAGVLTLTPVTSAQDNLTALLSAGSAT